MRNLTDLGVEFSAPPGAAGILLAPHSSLLASFLSTGMKGNEVDPGNWTGGIVNPKSEKTTRSKCPRNDVSTVLI